VHRFDCSKTKHQKISIPAVKVLTCATLIGVFIILLPYY